MPSSVRRASIFMMEDFFDLLLFDRRSVGLFTFTSGYDDCADGVTVYVDGGATHIEKSIGYPDHSNGFNGEANRGEDNGDGDEAGGRNSGNANAGGEGEDNDEELLPEVKRDLSGSGVKLGNKEYNDTFVEGGAVHINGRAKGKGKGTGLFRELSTFLNSFDSKGKGGGGTGGGEGG